MLNKPSQTEGLQSNRNRKGHFKVTWEEPKTEKYGLLLTPTAKNWLKSSGGGEFIEKLSRGMIDIICGEVIEKP